MTEDILYVESSREVVFCTNCQKPSVKENGFIATKNDCINPQPDNYGCECPNATFTSLFDIKLGET